MPHRWKFIIQGRKSVLSEVLWNLINLRLNSLTAKNTTNWRHLGPISISAVLSVICYIEQLFLLLCSSLSRQVLLLLTLDTHFLWLVVSELRSPINTSELTLTVQGPPQLHTLWNLYAACRISHFPHMNKNSIMSIWLFIKAKWFSLILYT